MEYNYHDYTEYLCDDDVLSLEHFQASDLGSISWIDVRRCFNECHVNPDHVFELFGAFSEMDPFTLKMEMVCIIKHDSKRWLSTSHIYLGIHSLSLKVWLDHMENPNVNCDELMVFTLSVTHNGYTVILNKNQLWTTVK